jgi:nodulation protein E
MALVAAREAVSESGIEFDEELGLKSATVIGTALGGQHSQEDNYKEVYRNGKLRVHPFLAPRLMANAPVSHVSMEFGLKGPAWSVSTACASSTHSIGQAFQLVRSGVADAALTGGTESCITWGTLKAWEGLRVMSKEVCRPFSKNRKGMVQGEGAAVLVLEEMEHAKARGAPIWGEIVGFGMTADASDIVQPDLNGASRALSQALTDGGVAPDSVDYINAHGTGTAANDRTECAAIREVFGAHADALCISSTKSMHGHCLGGAGALEMAATLMTLRDGVIPPTINYQEPDPDCDLDVTPNEARQQKVETAVSNSFAFGGLNAVLAARRV